MRSSRFIACGSPVMMPLSSIGSTAACAVSVARRLALSMAAFVPRLRLAQAVNTAMMTRAIRPVSTYRAIRRDRLTGWSKTAPPGSRNRPTDRPP